jgi:hypothetical protein
MLIAGVLGLFFDLLGWYLALWYYESSSFPEYLLIILSTWIFSTPVMMAVYIDFQEILAGFKFPSIKIKISKLIYFVIFVISGLVFCIQAYFRLTDLQNNITPQFFIIMLISGMLAEEALMGLLKVRNLFDRVVSGEYLTIFTIIVAGFFVGLIWELFNTQFRLWTYTNLPPGDILGIPIFVVGFYGTINYTYYNFCQIINAAPKILSEYRHRNMV